MTLCADVQRFLQAALTGLHVFLGQVGAGVAFCQISFEPCKFGCPAQKGLSLPRQPPFPAYRTPYAVASVFPDRHQGAVWQSPLARALHKRRQPGRTATCAGRRHGTSSESQELGPWRDQGAVSPRVPA